MRIPRIYLPIPLKENDTTIVLDAVSSNYVLNVLRLPIDSSLILFNGEDVEFASKLTAIANKNAIVKIEKFQSDNRESSIRIHLIQGISRGEKMDFTIQKAVELGVTSITPLFTEYCNVKLEGDRLQKRVEHWQRVAVSASEQCGRCKVPEILPAQKIDKLIALPKKGLHIVLDPKSSNKLSDCKKDDLANEFTLIIGPEGGLSCLEIELLQKNNFLGLNLGPRILRTETAALVAISVLQCMYGDI